MHRIFSAITGRLMRNGRGAKERWKQCRECGTITDVDESNCPSLVGPGHVLHVVDLSAEEVQRACKEGRIMTKNHMELARKKV